MARSRSGTRGRRGPRKPPRRPGGFTPSGVAIVDPSERAAIELPAIEVHLSNTAARESFRHISLLGPVCVGRIEGLGADGYEFALLALARRIAVTR